MRTGLRISLHGLIPALPVLALVFGLASCTQAVAPGGHELNAVQSASKPVLTDSSSRIAYMRKNLRPYWAPIEAGGIFMLADMDDAINARVFTELASGIPALAAETDGKKWQGLADLLADDVEIFFRDRSLAPGPYALDNYHLAYATQGKIHFNSDGDAPTVLPAEKTFTFNLTAEHLLLLRHMNIRSWQGMLEAMDPKRPYGDMTYYFIDMADALKEPVARDAKGKVQFTPAQNERYLKLHRDMLFAVQAFWTYAK